MFIRAAVSVATDQACVSALKMSTTAVVSPLPVQSPPAKMANDPTLAAAGKARATVRVAVVHSSVWTLKMSTTAHETQGLTPYEPPAKRANAPVDVAESR